MTDCVSLEIAKKLKELGISVNSAFSYKIYPGYEDIIRLKFHAESVSYHYVRNFNPESIIDYPAYTSDELLYLLPDSLYLLKEFPEHKEHIRYELCIYKKEDGYEVDYEDYDSTFSDQYFDGAKLSDALAKLLIHLKQNKLI